MRLDAEGHPPRAEPDLRVQKHAEANTNDTARWVSSHVKNEGRYPPPRGRRVRKELRSERKALVGRYSTTSFCQDTLRLGLASATRPTESTGLGRLRGGGCGRRSKSCGWAPSVRNMFGDERARDIMVGCMVTIAGERRSEWNVKMPPLLGEVHGRDFDGLWLFGDLRSPLSLDRGLR